LPIGHGDEERLLPKPSTTPLHEVELLDEITDDGFAALRGNAAFEKTESGSRR
jgi:hypothetical protein